MSAVVLGRSRDRGLEWWFAAAALVIAFALLAMAPLGVVATDVNHWVAYRLITGQISVWDAVWYMVALLPWWFPVSGAVISALYWWCAFVVAFGWEGLGVAIAAISWTGVGAFIAVLLGAALIG